jgi:redox-sensitive bicupin YhaK (pirin superfamily)
MGAMRASMVRPHPHIGLSTVTYLFTGEIMHRDSLGNALLIRPGELNWMTAGRGIAHSERTPPELRSLGSKLFGIQSWVALSAKDEEVAPDFLHYGAEEMPVLGGEGKVVRVIAGSVLGATSPVRSSSEMFYADVSMNAGASMPLDPDYEERAIYTVNGEVEIAGDVFGQAQLLVFRPAIASLFEPKPMPVSWRLAVRRWTVLGTSGGTSYHRERTVLSRPKLIGRWDGLIRCLETLSSFRFPRPERPDCRHRTHPPRLRRGEFVASG